MSDATGYDASQIQVLEGLEAVRKRPSMYIGSTDTLGLHHLVYEVVDNSIDEAMAGYCTEINVSIRQDGSVSVKDNGRGIPVDIHPQYNRPALEIVMTMLHAGGKFDHESYSFSGGLHGVGVSVVNALSEWMEVEVRRNRRIYWQRYEHGNVASEVEVRGESEHTGATVTFKPDATIFEDTEYNFDTLSSRLRELAFLNRGLKITIKDERTDKENDFRYEGGIVSFVEYLNTNKEALHKPPVYFSRSKNGTQVEVALQYNNSYNENIFSYANNINTREGGTHLMGFRAALTKTVNEYARVNKLLKNEAKLGGEDLREGLVAVISVKLPDPQFEGQTKTRLGNSAIRGIIESMVQIRAERQWKRGLRIVVHRSDSYQGLIARLVNVPVCLQQDDNARKCCEGSAASHDLAIARIRHMRLEAITIIVPLGVDFRRYAHSQNAVSVQLAGSLADLLTKVILAVRTFAFLAFVFVGSPTGLAKRGRNNLTCKRNTSRGRSPPGRRNSNGR